MLPAPVGVAHHVDALDRHPGAPEERIRQIARTPGEREHRAVVVLVGVLVQQAHAVSPRPLPTSSRQRPPTPAPPAGAPPHPPPPPGRRAAPRAPPRPRRARSKGPQSPPGRAPPIRL